MRFLSWLYIFHIFQLCSLLLLTEDLNKEKKKRSHDTVRMQRPLEISSTKASIVVLFNSASHYLIQTRAECSLILCYNVGRMASDFPNSWLGVSSRCTYRIQGLFHPEALPSIFSKDPRTIWSDMSRQLPAFLH